MYARFDDGHLMSGVSVDTKSKFLPTAPAAAARYAQAPTTVAMPARQGPATAPVYPRSQALYMAESGAEEVTIKPPRWSRVKKAVKGVLGMGGKPSGHTLIYLRFTIKDMEAIKPHLDGMVEATKAEEGCLYYGWTICGDKLQCRETYADGKAAAIHLANAGPLVGKMLESGAAELDSISIMG